MCGLGSESTVGFVILVILTKFGTGCNWRNFMSILHFKFKSISLSLTFSSLSRSMQDRDRAVPFKEHASCTQHRAMPCKDRAVACSSVQCRCSAVQYHSRTMQCCASRTSENLFKCAKSRSTTTAPLTNLQFASRLRFLFAICF